MKQTFKIAGNEYQRSEISNATVAMKILPSMFGTTIKDITYEQLAVITTMLNNGWDLLPGFYGEKTDAGTLLKPNLSWFSLFCRDEKSEDKIIYQYAACVNYKTNEINLYNSERLIGTYPCLNDMFENIDRFHNSYPLKCDGYYDNQVLSNVEYFDNNKSFDEICAKNNKVYIDMDANGLGFYVDYEKLNILN